MVHISRWCSEFLRMQAINKEFLIIVLASALPFLLSLHGDFVFDDSEAIVKNNDVTSASWLDSFSNDFWGTNIKSNLSHKSYRPLTIISFRLNYYINGRNLSATQFKVTNLLCHITCSILVWMTCNCICDRVKKSNHLGSNANIPFIAAIMFSVHPVHVEAICGIVGRADLLATATFLLSFLIYDKALRCHKILNKYLFISITLAGISMLFKENGITVLGVCCVYDLILHMKSRPQDRLKNKSVLFLYKDINVGLKCFYRITCVVFFTIMFLYIRWVIMGATKPEFKPTDNPAAFSDDLFTKVFTYSYIYFLNILLLIWPQWLCYDWSMGCVRLIKDPYDFRIILPFMLYLFGITFIKTIIIKSNRASTKRLLIMGLSLIVIPFLPAANIIYPVGFVIAERILYISSVGYCLLISAGYQKMIEHKGNSRKKPIIALLYFTIFIYALRSCQRSFHWQNEYKLFTSALTVCPLNAKVHYNVAKAADATNNTAWALNEYREAIRLFPEYYQAMNNLANLLKNQKQYEEAESLLRKSIQYKEDFPAAWMNLGIVLAHMKRYKESEIAYKRAFLYRRNYPDCHYNLGNLYLEMKKNQEAMENWYYAINLNSKHAAAWTNLLALLDNTGQTEKAIQIIPKALGELPYNPAIHFAIANIYGKINQYEDAEQHYYEAIRLFKDRVQPIHYTNLGVLYQRWEKWDLAEEMYINAIKIGNHYESAMKKLQNLYKNKKRNMNLPSLERTIN